MKRTTENPCCLEFIVREKVGAKPHTRKENIVCKKLVYCAIQKKVKQGRCIGYLILLKFHL
jgi:hypothetical protein